MTPTYGPLDGARWWEKVLRAATVVMLVGLIAISGWALVAGLDTNQIVSGQEEQKVTSDCKSDYAVADRVSSSNLDVTKAEEIDLFTALVLGGRTPDLLARFDAAHQRTTAAIGERVMVAELQGGINEKCAPDENGNTVPAPIVDPIEALEENT